MARGGVALLSAVVLTVTGYGWAVQSELDEDIVTSDVVDGPADPGGPVTALLVGIDSRTDARGRPLPPELLEQLRAGEDEGQLNTDTIILLHLPADHAQEAVAVSIPRDSFVEIAGGRGQHKINSAYPRAMADVPDLPGLSVAQQREREAGRRTLVRTVERLTGTEIDHFAEINLAGFVEISEVVGGVPVCLNAAVDEPRSGMDLPAGRQTVQGADALAFVRQRHGLDGGDLDRITRQQAFLSGVAATALSPRTLTDPARVERLVQAVARHVVLDSDWDAATAVRQLRRAADGVEFRTIPTGTPALETPFDGIAVEVDPAEVRRFVADAFDDAPEPAASPATPTAAAPTPPPIAVRPVASAIPCVD